MTEEPNTSITLNEGRMIFIDESTDNIDFIKNSNIPHFNVEDHKNWKSHKLDDDTNLLGQIHHTSEHGVIFHLCYNPVGKVLTKNDLKALIQGIEHLEEFVKRKDMLKTRGK